MRGRLGLLLSLLLFGLVAVPPVAAGSEAVPEITDPADDQDSSAPPCAGGSAGNQGAACMGTRIDVLKAWIDNETATTLNFNILLTAVPAGTNTFNHLWEFHAKGSAGDVVVSATAPHSTTPGTSVPPVKAGVTEAVAVEGNVLVLTAPKSAFGTATSLTELYVSTVAYPVNSAEALITDRAPDSGAAPSVYTYGIGTGGGGGGLPGDADGDGLKDGFEEEHFNNATSPQTGSGDPDSDTLNNTREQELGTDPTKADTDGDGVKDGQEATDGTDPKKADSDGDGASDGAEKAAGTDPKDPASKPSAQTSSSTSPTSTTSTSRATTSSTTTGTDGDDLDTGYLGASVAAAVVLIILGLVAIFGRWGA